MMLPSNCFLYQNQKVQKSCKALNIEIIFFPDSKTN